MARPKINPNLKFLRDNINDTRICVLQGGTRSGKTYSALQFIVETCFQYSGLTISIVRATFPALRSTVMRDFFEILESFDAYERENHNKTEHTYNLNGNLIEFMSIDQGQKVRGRKRDLLYCNEANEIDLESWRQLLFRTVGRIIIDFNPSDVEHWIYSQVQPRDYSDTLITTYKYNPFLNEDTINEIERLKDIDPEYWEVFGLGQKGQGLRGVIFKKFEHLIEMPKGNYTYGLDFGFTNDPTSLTRSCLIGDNIYLEELIYQKGLTNSELAKLIKSIGVRGRIYADAADPRSIHELRQYGIDVVAAKKGADSVNQGILFLKSKKLHIKGDNAIKEARSYKWKLDADGNPTNTPIDAFNHFWDSARYANVNSISSTRPMLKRVNR